MPNIVGFTQDPQGVPGMGDFHFDSGHSMYAHDPETAQQFLAANDAGAPMMSDAGGDRSVAPPQMSDAGGPSMSPRQGVTTVEPAEASAPPAQQSAQLPPDDMYRAQMASYLRQPEPAATGHAGKPHMVAKGQTESYERTGAPYSAEDANTRGDLNNSFLLAKQQEAQTLQERARVQQLQYQAQAPVLEVQAAQRQKALLAAQGDYQQERAHLDQMMAKSKDAEDSFDANRWFKSRGTVGQVMTAIAQAFGAYAATLSGGQNWVGQEIDGFIKSDIANQEAAIRAGHAGTDNALKQLQLKFGDMDQAKAALEIAQRKSIDNMAAYMASGSQQEDVKNAFQTFMAQNAQQREAQEQQFRDAAIGKRSGTVTSTMVTPGAGSENLRHKHFMERAEELSKEQELGITPDTSRAGRALEMKQKADPGEAKRRDQLDALDSSLRNAEELDKLYAKPGILSRADRGRMEYLQSVSPMEVHKALTGMSRFTDTEGERYSTAYGKQGETMDYSGKHRAALGALREDLARKKAALQRGAGGVAEEEHPDIQDVE